MYLVQRLHLYRLHPVHGLHRLYTVYRVYRLHGLYEWLHGVYVQLGVRRCQLRLHRGHRVQYLQPGLYGVH